MLSVKVPSQAAGFHPSLFLRGKYEAALQALEAVGVLGGGLDEVHQRDLRVGRLPVGRAAHHCPKVGRQENLPRRCGRDGINGSCVAAVAREGRGSMGRDRMESRVAAGWQAGGAADSDGALGRVLVSRPPHALWDGPLAPPSSARPRGKPPYSLRIPSSLRRSAPTVPSELCPHCTRHERTDRDPPPDFLLLWCAIACGAALLY